MESQHEVLRTLSAPRSYSGAVPALLSSCERTKNHYKKGAVPVFIAPYLSPEAQSLCREQDVSFLDFEGNVRLVFDSVFIDRQVASKPVVEMRELRSIFKPKSAQVLRVLLRGPNRPWRVTDLAQTAAVSPKFR